MTSSIAAAFLAAAARDGLHPPNDLRLLSPRATASVSEPDGSSHAVGDGTGLPPCRGPVDLGPLHEAVTTGADQRHRGAWYTPPDLAARMAVRALDAATIPAGGDHPVLDPACGGGGLLLAAADERRRRGQDAALIVASTVGIDVDTDAVAVAEAALWWWAARHGHPEMRPDVRTGDGLLDPLPPAAVVVANPPFRSQLRTATTDDADRRRRLAERWEGAVRPYTDTAWLFLLAVTEAAVPGAGLAVLQPRSVLAARDAGPVRTRIETLATLRDCEIVDGHTFAAEVELCLPVLHRNDGTDAGGGSVGSTAVEPRADGPRAGNDRGRGPVRWTGPLADHAGIPRVALPDSGAMLGTRATVRAGFRDEYYGLVGAVSEGGAGPRLVTVGAIDPWRVLDRPVRFARASFDAPRIRADALEGRAADWVRIQAAPKILVATQTRIVEAVADPDATLVGGVPVLAVVPHDPADLWHLLAVLCSPPVSAAVVRATIGTGLAADACRPTASVLAAISLPGDATAWDEAAISARRCHRAAGTASLDAAERAFADVATTMYGADRDVRDWWVAAAQRIRNRPAGGARSG